MTSPGVGLRRTLALWVPVLVLLAGLVVLGIGDGQHEDDARSAGVFPARVVATGSRQYRTADVEFTGPDGRTTTVTVEHRKRGVYPGDEVQVRVWPAERRVALEYGVSHEATMVVGGVLALLGAGGWVVAVVRRRRERRRS
ncbi:hypothetical protein [Amycolatopsis solani]|uniref:hypothetical protein n=1 Tax=Amycolatopsis solani TaxID=3028615 RepID=UPI0025AF10D8|nr:hypothetical protein [Amycolatopsis sp. MEP2-6]